MTVCIDRREIYLQGALRTDLKLVIKKIPLFAIFFIALKAVNTQAAACFDGEKLQNLLKTSPKSLIYVWSPRMVLSVTQAHLAAAQAKLLGVQFVPLVDGRISAAEWQSALKQAAGLNPSSANDVAVLSGSDALCAATLIDQDAYLHFPTAFIAQNGQIHPQKLVGAMPANFWRMGITARQTPAMTSGMTPVLTPLKTLSESSLAQATEKAVIKVSEPASEKVGEQCIAPNQFIALDPKQAGLDDNKEVALGAYERISPDGRFVLRSYSGKRLTAVSVVELPSPPLGAGTANAAFLTQRMFETPFSNEAFPVQGSWRYLVDTNGSHYEFSSVLRDQSAAKPLFKGGMTGFYAAAAEVDSTYPRRSKQAIRIRSLSWPNASGETDSQGEGMLTVRTLTVDAAQQRVLSDSGRVNLCLDRISIDGPMYALPMLSVDGREFATLPQTPVAGVPTMRIFGLGADGQQCEPRAQFKSQSGKVIFGFAKPQMSQKQEGQGDRTDVIDVADVAYEYRGQIWWYQRATATPLNLAPWEDPPQSAQFSQTVTHRDILASAFPGVTRDGRVIYAATWKRCKGTVCTPEGGYVVSDPWQSNAYKSYAMQHPTQDGVAGQSCITVQDVIRERAAFAAFHGISN